MTENWGTTPEDLMFSTNKLLKNISFSSGTTITTTQTYDYDQDCFFIPDEYIFSISENDKKAENISSLYEKLKNHLVIENVENIFYWCSIEAEKEGYLDIFTRWIVWFVDKEEFFRKLKVKNIDHYISQDILYFCEEWGIKKYLFMAIEILKKHFPQYKDLNISIEKDREIDEEWIVLDITLEGEIEEILDRYDKYSGNLVYSIPWPERDKIRLSYNIT